MRKASLIVLAVAAAASLTGCVQMHSDIVIGEDGSGTAELRLSASASVIETIEEMQKLSPDAGEEMDVSVFDEIDEAELRAAGKEHGVKVEAFEKQSAGERKTLHLSLAFRDLKGLSYVMGKAMGDGPGDGMGIFDAGGGNLVLRSTTYDFPAEPDEEEETVEPGDEDAPAGMGPEDMQRQMELMGKLMASMSELDIGMRITVPGEVVESNAPVIEGRTSVWSINAANAMQQQADLEPEITFSGKGLKIKPLTE